LNRPPMQDFPPESRDLSLPAKSFGEPLTGYDPEISEWDNPRRDYLPSHSEFIAV
jgi:hypothetical protein